MRYNVCTVKWAVISIQFCVLTNAYTCITISRVINNFITLKSFLTFFFYSYPLPATPPKVPIKNWSVLYPYNFAYSKVSYKWNHTVYSSFLIVFFNFSLHSIVFCISSRCTALWLGNYTSPCSPPNTSITHLAPYIVIRIFWLYCLCCSTLHPHDYFVTTYPYFSIRSCFSLSPSTLHPSGNHQSVSILFFHLFRSLDFTYGPKRYYAKWNNSDRKWQIPYDFTYMFIAFWNSIHLHSIIHCTACQ